MIEEGKIRIINNTKELVLYDMVSDHFASKQEYSLYDEQNNPKSFEEIFSPIGSFIPKQKDGFSLRGILFLDESEPITFMVNKKTKIINAKLPEEFLYTRNPTIINMNEEQKYRGEINMNEEQKYRGGNNRDDERETFYMKRITPLAINLTTNYFSSKFLQVIKIGSNREIASEQIEIGKEIRKLPKDGIYFSLRITLSQNINRPIPEQKIKNSISHWVEQFKYNRNIIIMNPSTTDENNIKKLIDQSDQPRILPLFGEENMNQTTFTRPEKPSEKLITSFFDNGNDKKNIKPPTPLGTKPKATKKKKKAAIVPPKRPIESYFINLNN